MPDSGPENPRAPQSLVLTKQTQPIYKAKGILQPLPLGQARCTRLTADTVAVNLQLPDAKMQKARERPTEAAGQRPSRRLSCPLCPGDMGTPRGKGHLVRDSGNSAHRRRCGLGGRDARYSLEPPREPCRGQAPEPPRPHASRDLCVRLPQGAHSQGQTRPRPDSRTTASALGLPTSRGCVDSQRGKTR